MGEFLSGYGAPLFWMLVALAAAVAEAMTCNLVAIWFMPAALITLFLSFYVKEAWILWTVFLVLSTVTMLFARTVLKKFNVKKENRTNADALIGERGMTLEAIDNLHESGSVKIGGLVWTARSEKDGEVIPAGTVVVIRAIQGVKLICLPADQK